MDDDASSLAFVDLLLAGLGGVAMPAFLNGALLRASQAELPEADQEDTLTVTLEPGLKFGEQVGIMLMDQQNNGVSPGERATGYEVSWIQCQAQYCRLRLRRKPDVKLSLVVWLRQPPVEGQPIEESFIEAGSFSLFSKQPEMIGLEGRNGYLWRYELPGGGGG